MSPDIDCNGYHNSGTQRFRAIGIPFIAPSTTFAYRCARPSLEKVEVRPPATLIFFVPRWLAWGRPIPASWLHRAGGAHPGRMLSVGRRALHTGDVAGPAGGGRRGSVTRRPDDAHRGSGCRTRHPGCGILPSAGAGGELARCQAVVDFRRHRGCCDRIPRARRIFSGCPAVRAS
jgi:hypothetical protein